MTIAQPFAAFPFPFGLMLAPEPQDDERELAEALRELAAGRLPGHWPAALEPQRRALTGDLPGALAALGEDDAADESDASHDATSERRALARYNRYVLDPVGRDPGRAASGLPAPQRALVEVVRFSAGEREDPPPPGVGDGPVAGALVLCSQAAVAAARGDQGLQAALLLAAAQRVAAIAPPFAAVLRGEAGGVLSELSPDSAQAAELLVGASAELAQTDLVLSRAELEYRLGALAHAREGDGGSLQVAMRHYNDVLALISRDDAPYLWAQTQLNLAAAYLAAQMAQASDTLRVGVAVQALRAALEVFVRDEYPDEWAAASLDLANALVYAPSAKQGDNLVEAVELYEQVLSVRPGDVDPAGRARVLANQGNALAHLGIFDHAVAKLAEAQMLFRGALEHEAALTVGSLLDQIARERQKGGEQ